MIKEVRVTSLGLIAQEVYKVIPEAVNKPVDESQNIWTIDYQKLIPILINAVKELNVENEIQNVEIERLRSENNALRNSLEKLKTLDEKIAVLEKLSN